MSNLIPIMTMGALGFLFALGLVFAYRKLAVEIDPRIEQIAESLPQANCAACGYAGCQALAEAIAAGKAAADSCPVGGAESAGKISGILGVEAGEVIKKVARLHCRGTKHAAPRRSEYLGLKTCYASHLMGGDKLCTYGCLGLADCVRSCVFNAMYMGEDGLPVIIEENCTACGKCVEACPRNLLELHPISQNILVFCRSEDRGAVARKACKNACIACGICSRACPEAIVIENNLAVITDYKKIPPEKIPEIEKCPTLAIGRLKKDNEG
ncbi:MAG TPA: electron transporter RnfB [Candidatus Aminicenantes bacterium]|nr:electron transporter RnfB [Candidatus Aminicenantes bacterium]